MKRKEAEIAIRAILKALPASELPKLRIEKGAEYDIAWHGGHGFHLGRASRGGEFDPDVHISMGLLELFGREATRRLDKRRGPKPEPQGSGS